MCRCKAVSVLEVPWTNNVSITSTSGKQLLVGFYPKNYFIIIIFGYLLLIFLESVPRKTGADVKKVCNFINNRLKYAASQMKKGAVDSRSSSSITETDDTLEE